MDPVIRPLVKLALADIGQEDITAALLPKQTVRAAIVAKEDGYVSGLDIVMKLLSAFSLHATSCVTEGQAVAQGTKVLEVEGDIQTILSVERTALNVLQRMSGITTMVRECRISAPGVRIAATRKTLFPTYDKKAVLAGGGDPHRWRLDDMYLLKDNHLACMSITDAVHRAKKRLFTKKVEVEAETAAQALEAAEAGADIILLDNMTPERIRETIAMIRAQGHDRVLFEASGGITLTTLPAYAEAGVDIISLGALTHSVKALDLSLEILR